MRTIKVQFGGKGYKVDYRVETIDLSMTPLQFINVYSVFIKDEDLQKIIGNHFTMVHNSLHIVKPAYDVKSSSNSEEVNLKKTIAQQIINNPTE